MSLVNDLVEHSKLTQKNISEFENAMNYNYNTLQDNCEDIIRE